MVSTPGSGQFRHQTDPPTRLPTSFLHRVALRPFENLTIDFITLTLPVVAEHMRQSEYEKKEGAQNEKSRAPVSQELPDSPGPQLSIDSSRATKSHYDRSRSAAGA